jgi:N-methylhydantoinase B
LLEVRCVLDVVDSDLHFSLQGDPQVDAFVNSGEGASFGSVMVALLTRLGFGDLPFNAGMWRPIHIDLGTPGSIVNPTAPAPVSLGHAEAGTRVTTAVNTALNQAVSLSRDDRVRGRVAGTANDSTNIAGLFGVDDRGAPTVLFYMDGAAGLGGPAQTVGDGQDAYGMSMMSGCGIPDVELAESTDPVLFLWRRLHTNSGGPGQSRGGLGTDRAYVLTGADSVHGFNTVILRQRPAVGNGGGAPASAGNQYAVRGSNVTALMDEGVHPTSVDEIGGHAEVGKAKDGRYSLYRQDTFRTIGGGGSGLGDPLLRDPDDVGQDVYDGYVSVMHARAAYGVAVDPDGVVDVEATTDLREKIRTERIGRTPEVPLSAPISPGVSVQISADGRHWTCAHCGRPLCPSDQDWKISGTVARTEGIDAWIASRDMRIHPRTVEPAIVVSEYSCGSCAASLQVDVLPEGVTYSSPRVDRAWLETASDAR